jgi:putative ABC transport system permease protein
MWVMLRGERYGREQEAEIRFHLELESLAEEQRFGNVTYYREEARAMTALRIQDRLRQDLTYAIRGLRRSPGFTLTVILTLALGFGVNAAMFSMLDSLFFRRPAGVPHAAELRRLYMEVHRQRGPVLHLIHDSFRYPQYQAVADAVPETPIAAASPPDSAELVSEGHRVAVRASETTGNYFSILRLRPQTGRFFAPDEDHVETPAFVAVIADELWRRQFNADPRVIGRSVTIDRRPFTIVGVAPRDFHGVNLETTDVWVPLNTHVAVFMGMPGPWYRTFSSNVQLFMRPADSAEEQQVLGRATNALRGVNMNGYEFDPKANVITGSIIHEQGPMQRADEIMVANRVGAMAVIVLLIACANVVNLLLLRASGRRREIAVRRALGVSQRRLLEQNAVESLVLALAGGFAALIVAYWAGSATRRLMMPRVHWSTNLLDARTVAFVLSVSVVVGLLAGTAPALQGMRVNLIDSLRAGSRDLSYRPSSLRAGLLVAQTSLCVLLLVGAGLFLRSLSNVRSIALGYDVDNVILVSPQFSDGAMPHSADLKEAVPILSERLAHVPGVARTAYASTGPMYGITFVELFLPGLDSLPRLGDQATPYLNSVSPAFFDAAGARIVIGRGFTNADGVSGAPVVIVNETMARTYWPGEQAIGKCLVLVKRTNPCASVVGVAADAHAMRIVEGPRMMYYRPLSQAAATPMTIVVRLSGGSIDAVRAEAEGAVRALLPASEAVRVRAMSSVLEPELRPWRLGATLFTGFAVLALAIAGVGIYSIVAYGVSQRTNELGIRIALGAARSDILDLVVGEGARVVGIGIGIGIIASLAAGRLLNALLFGVSATDASLLIAAAAALGALAIVACALPAWRAARVDPAIALRAD